LIGFGCSLLPFLVLKLKYLIFLFLSNKNLILTSFGLILILKCVYFYAWFKEKFNFDHFQIFLDSKMLEFLVGLTEKFDFEQFWLFPSDVQRMNVIGLILTLFIFRCSLWFCILIWLELLKMFESDCVCDCRIWEHLGRRKGGVLTF
jgi:hypothetical protein